jgi:hypothetical protein
MSPPAGRLIGTQNLSDVLWDARNQAMHWETDDVRKRTVACFETLASDIDPKYGEYPKHSLAFDVVELLDWLAANTFNADLGSLG